MEEPTLDSIRHIVAEVRGDRAAKVLTISDLVKLKNAGYTDSYLLEIATHSDLLAADLNLATVRALLPAEGKASSVKASYSCEIMRAHRAWESARVDT